MDEARQRYVAELRQAIARTPAAPHGVGRGIVTCGATTMAPLLWTLVRSVRARGCTLPIELWCRRDEADEALYRLLAPQGVCFREAPEWPAGARHARAAHALKPWAMAHSAFREVLFLDADNCVFRDPTFLFDSEEFRRCRAVFWPDWGAPTAPLGGPQLRRDLGLDGAGVGVEFESGQLLLDTIDHWPALAATLHVNEHCDYYFRFLHGDKETYRLAFDLRGDEYFVVPTAPLLKKGLIQHWVDGQPLFHHRCGGAKRLLPRPANLPALPAAEVRANAALFAQHWTITPRDRLRVWWDALRYFAQQTSRPAAVRSALATRMRRFLRA